MFNLLNIAMIGIYILVIPIVVHSAKKMIDFVKDFSYDEEW